MHLMMNACLQNCSCGAVATLKTFTANRSTSRSVYFFSSKLLLRFPAPGSRQASTVQRHTHYCKQAFWACYFGLRYGVSR
jgi:hypothetical protein